MSIFGTDGLRGKVNEYPMTPEIAMKIAAILGHKSFSKKEGLCRVVIGKDTRRSCYMIESAMTAGLIASGADVILTGPVPTPAISMLTKSLRAEFGIMISASHNLFEDNGIKIFDSNGIKISDEMQHEIEKLLQLPYEKFYTESSLVGKVRRLDDVIGRYIEFVKSSISKDINFNGVKIVLDVANGAAYKIAPEIFRELGAEVFVLNDEPDGKNINSLCGSTHPDIISKKIKEMGFDIGIAVDGDADRLIICDEKGEVIDGDYIIGAIAKSMHSENKLTSNTVVLTVMSNISLEKFLNNLGLNVIRTAVGDRNVIKEMIAQNSNLGGEQSGHIILRDYSKTGDGILAAIQIISYLVKEKLKTSSITTLFKKTPQTLVNLLLSKEKKIDLNHEDIKSEITECEKILNGNGRILVRKSGTENLIRIMVEGEDAIKNKKCIQALEKVLEQTSY
jgi:phosphoglucosamine mutase